MMCASAQYLRGFECMRGRRIWFARNRLGCISSRLGGKTEIWVKLALSSCGAVISLAFLSGPAFAQPSASPSSTSSSSPVERGIDLAGKRHCQEALPLLNEFTPRVTDKQLKYRAQMAIARCAMKQKDGKA